MKKIAACSLIVITMVALCACGTTEKWLLTRTMWSHGYQESTYTYDDRGNVTEVLETEGWGEDPFWLSIHMKNNKVDYVESNGNELLNAPDSLESDPIYEVEILVDDDYEFTINFYNDGACYRKMTWTVNEQGRAVHKSTLLYGDRTRTDWDCKYDANNILIEETTTWIDWDTEEVIDKQTTQYYCTYDSNGNPTYLYRVGDDEYSDEPQCQFIWHLVEVKK